MNKSTLEVDKILARDSIDIVGSSTENQLNVNATGAQSGIIRLFYNDSSQRGIYDHTSGAQPIVIDQNNKVTGTFNDIIIKDTNKETGVPSAFLQIGDDAYFCDVDVEGKVALNQVKQVGGDRVRTNERGTLSANLEGTARIALYASADTSKGTIEERLTNLGFKQGSVSLSLGSATENVVQRQGNYCFVNISCSLTGSAPGGTQSTNKTTHILKGTVDSVFYPKTPIYNTIKLGNGTCHFTLSATGVLDVYITTTTTYTYALSRVNFGYEASPIA